ncbi:tetratricopeptide repeat protein [Leucobacter sp. CSA1]|uniref:Tetratricopeptide repeat protein n=1 Tax=Leucobacter chromiisoli TaxID=2796471 RepID=A0A934Q959_9MICO|nr:tetratricopeptide repeat protein [Leucobacter chromiisoli]MBK0420053.1 tetratricopeptide repeat protein [Leucobacter chromiisoli]
MTQQIPERIPGGGMDLSHLAARAQSPRGEAAGGGGPQGGAPGGGGQVVDVPSVVLDVTDQTFEQVAQLSTVVPIVVDLWAEWCQPCKTLGPILERVTRESGGRVVLAKVDVDANPGLAQAFQAQSIPTVVAIVGGRPVPLFQGALPEPQVREFFDRLIELAEQQGVAGRVSAPDLDGAPEAPAEPEIPPAHLAAVEAAERGDYATAISEYEAVLAKAPADAEARAALVQLRLLHRLEGLSAEEIRAGAAAAPSDVDAQMRVADLDVSGGHVEDAFLRLLELFEANREDADRARIRERLLELFEVVGVADPRVIAARGRLANLLY